MFTICNTNIKTEMASKHSSVGFERKTVNDTFINKKNKK